MQCSAILQEVLPVDFLKILGGVLPMLKNIPTFTTHIARGVPIWGNGGGMLTY